MPKKTQKQKTPLKLSQEEKLKRIHNQIHENSYKYIQAKTGLSYYIIKRYCVENNIKPKRKSKGLGELTKKRLKKLAGINTSKKNQNQLTKILGFRTRQSCSYFLRNHNIEYKESYKNSITKKRLEILADLKKIKKMSIEKIADKLGFEGEYANQYTKKFLKDKNIDINN